MNDDDDDDNVFVIVTCGSCLSILLIFFALAIEIGVLYHSVVKEVMVMVVSVMGYGMGDGHGMGMGLGDNSTYNTWYKSLEVFTDTYVWGSRSLSVSCYPPFF